ncbi:MAG: hypothetical protein JST63_20360 [Bacteroidetes bacterium]|nr:hypothetical protein [Bacteroidota bacterium]
MTNQAFYEEKIRFYQKAIKALKAKISFFGLLRVAVFAVFAFLVYFAVVKDSYLLGVLAVMVLVGFVALVKYAIRLNERRALLKELLFVNENEREMLKGALNRFEDGKSFAGGNNYYDDLDIFGSRSLYHLLNRCSTSHGRERLADVLKQPLFSKEEIEQRQAAVSQFAPQADIRQMITAYGLLHKETEGNLHSVGQWLESGEQLHKNRMLQAARWVLPLYNIPCLLVYIATGNFIYLLAGVALGWLITGRYAKYIHKQHQLIGKKQEVLDQYAGILKVYTGVDAGRAQWLLQLQQAAGSAYKSIGSLAKLSSFFDQRLNLLVNLFLNSILLYDLHCIIALEQWKAKHKKDFHLWLYVVGDIECLNALSSLSFNNPSFVFPRIAEENKIIIKTRELGHPLIPENERISNDFDPGESTKLLLVTGSNMSGKTTFLRTLGVNLVLAQCGAPVCAASFECSIMNILTSIRVSDSLQEHTSYFMAELKRLQFIIEELKQGKTALVLIDEILRGTNSEDKTYGSEQYITQLIKYNSLTLFATHDLALSALEEKHHGIIKNYCFESDIRNDTLFFDYKLRAGVAKNKNASFLMKQMGIIGNRG